MLVETSGVAVTLPCFVHINKNAGTTVRRLLSLNYPAESRLELMVQGRRAHDGRAKTVDSLDEDVHEAVTCIQDRQHDISCLAVNLPYGVHRYLVRSVTYFTFIREPVSRCISYWYFAHDQRDTGGLWSLLESYGFDVPAIVGDHAAFQFSNDQVRMLSGSSAAEPGADELALARQNVEERFLLAGAVEHIDACVAVLAGALGWETTPRIRENSRTNQDPALLPRQAKKWFREANEWDARLHDWLVADYLPRTIC